MLHLRWAILATALLGCARADQVELRSDNGNLRLSYACTDSGPRSLDSDVATLVRQLVSRENADHILAPTNPLAATPEAGRVQVAAASREIVALERAVAHYVCTHGHPPTRPPRFPEPGSAPPDFTASTLTLDGSPGAAVQLSDLRGRTVVLVFWSTWCPACREEYVELQALSERGRTEAISTYAILHADTKANLRRWLQEHGAGVAFLEDEGKVVARLYGVYGIPHTVVVRPNGALHVSGHVHPRDLQAAVDSAMTFTHREPG
jgi:peroxiredoxin